ncbi:MAG: hypothetical protein Q8930_07955 [Bacillota bacterium]|nr:hypothetical protein [Bacillota bacterium]
MKVLLSLVVMAAGYYSLSYGVYLWKNEESKLPGFGVILITLLGVILPIIDLNLKV